MKFKKKIKKIFGEFADLDPWRLAGKDTYSESPKNKIVLFSIKGRDLIFSNLEELSQVLGTKDINVWVADVSVCSGNHGDTCCYCTDDSRIEVMCSGVRFDER